MYFADPSLRPEAAPFLEMSWDPAAAQQLFGGTNQTFAAIAAAADASKPLPGFDMKGRLSGRFTGTTRPVSSANIVARLPGSDRALASEHLILSAHLDGVGTGPAINGDTINNGTLDNAAGVAALFDIATALQRDRPRRSILFVRDGRGTRPARLSLLLAGRPSLATALSPTSTTTWPFRSIHFAG